MPLLYLVGLVFGIPILILYLIAFIMDRRAKKAGFHYDLNEANNLKNPYDQAEEPLDNNSN